MIYETLECLAGELSEFFRAKLKTSEDKVVVSNIVNQNGTVAIQGENKLVLTLISLERERQQENCRTQAGHCFQLITYRLLL